MLCRRNIKEDCQELRTLSKAPRACVAGHRRRPGGKGASAGTCSNSSRPKGSRASRMVSTRSPKEAIAVPWTRNPANSTWSSSMPRRTRRIPGSARWLQPSRTALEGGWPGGCSAGRYANPWRAAAVQLERARRAFRQRQSFTGTFKASSPKGHAAGFEAKLTHVQGERIFAGGSDSMKNTGASNRQPRCACWPKARP